MGRALLKPREAYFLATAAFSFEPAVSLTEWPAGIWIASPVCGLRPVRAARSVRSTANQPGIDTFSPLEIWSTKTSNTASRTPLTATWEFSVFAATAATSSLRFIANVWSSWTSDPKPDFGPRTPHGRTDLSVRTYQTLSREMPENRRNTGIFSSSYRFLGLTASFLGSTPRSDTPLDATRPIFHSREDGSCPSLEKLTSWQQLPSASNQRSA